MNVLSAVAKDCTCPPYGVLNAPRCEFVGMRSELFIAECFSLVVLDNKGSVEPVTRFVLGYFGLLRLAVRGIGT